MTNRRSTPAALAATLVLVASSGCAATGGVDPQATRPAPVDEPVEHAMRFEVVGRGPVAHTRTTDLAAFRGVDGRDYVLTGTFGACQGCVGDRVYVWDVTDPARPALTDSVVVDANTVNGVDVNAAGTLAAMARRGAESRRNGVTLLDLSEPAHPRVVADFWETLLSGVQNLFFDGNHLYAVDLGLGDLAVIDVSDPADPRQIGRWGVDFRPDRYLSEVFVRDGLAYLSYWDEGLVILDVGNGVRDGTPEAPALVWKQRFPVEWRGQLYARTHYAFPYTNAAGRHYIFVGDEIIPPTADLNRPFPIGGMLHVLDATDVTRPEVVATYTADPHGIKKFWAEGDVLYVATNNGGLRALDVSGDLRGSIRRRELAVLRTADRDAYVPGLPMTWAVRPHAGLVFASDFNSGLWVARLAEDGG